MKEEFQADEELLQRPWGATNFVCLGRLDEMRIEGRADHAAVWAVVTDILCLT